MRRALLMLHFDDQPMETSLFSPESSARDEVYYEFLPEGSQLIEGISEKVYDDCLNDPETPTLPDNFSLSTPTLPDDLEGLDLYTTKWYADCFNDPEIPNDLYVSFFCYF